MKRRNFVKSTPVGMAALPAAAAGKQAVFELRYFRLRNGPHLQRTSDFLGKHFASAARRAGVGKMGFFAAVIGKQSPFVFSALSFPSFQSIEDFHDKLGADKEFQKGFDAYNSMVELSYIRMETFVTGL